MSFKPLTILMASAGLTPVHPCLSCSEKPTSAHSTPELVLPQLSRKETPPLTFSSTLANAAGIWPPLLARVQLVHYNPQVIFWFSSTASHLHCCMGLFHPWLRTWHLPFLQFMRLLLALFSRLPWSFCLPAYQPLPLSGITTKLLKGVSVLAFTFLNNLKQYWPQYKFLRDKASNQLAAGVCNPGHNLWSPVVQPIFYPPYPPESETISKFLDIHNHFSTSLQNNIDNFGFYHLKNK